MAQRLLTAEEVQRQIEELTAQNAALSAMAAAGGAAAAMAPLPGALALQQAALGVNPGLLLGLADPSLASVSATALESVSSAAAPPALQSVKAKREAEKKEREQKRKLRKLVEDAKPDDEQRPKPQGDALQAAQSHVAAEAGLHVELKRIEDALAKGEAVQWFKEVYSAEAQACSTDMIGDVALAKLRDARQRLLDKSNPSTDGQVAAPTLLGELPPATSVEEEPKKTSFLILKKNVIGAPKRKAAVRSAVRPVQSTATAEAPLPAAVASTGNEMYDPEAVSDDDDAPPPPPPPPPGGPPPPMEVLVPSISVEQRAAVPQAATPNGGMMAPFPMSQPAQQFEVTWGGQGPPGQPYSAAPETNNWSQAQQIPPPSHHLSQPRELLTPFRGQPAAGPSSQSQGGSHMMGPMRSHAQNLPGPSGPGLRPPPPPPPTQPMRNAHSDILRASTGPRMDSSQTSNGFWQRPIGGAPPAPPPGMHFKPVLEAPQPPNGFQGHGSNIGGQAGAFTGSIPSMNPPRPPPENGIPGAQPAALPRPGFIAMSSGHSGPPRPGPMIRLQPLPPPGPPRVGQDIEPRGPPPPPRPMMSVFHRPGPFGAMQPMISTAMPVLGIEAMVPAPHLVQPNGLRPPPRPALMLGGQPPLAVMMGPPPGVQMLPGGMQPPQ